MYIPNLLVRGGFGGRRLRQRGNDVPSFNPDTFGGKYALNNGTAAAATGTAAAGLAAVNVIPVVGQVISIAATIVGVGQALKAQSDQQLLQNIAMSQQEQYRIMAQELGEENLAGSLELKRLGDQIDVINETKSKQTTYLIISASLIGLTAFLFAFKIKRKK